MQCLPRTGSTIAPQQAPGREAPGRPESTGAAGKRAAEEARTPKADVMHPTHGCCGRESPGFSATFQRHSAAADLALDVCHWQPGEA
ncbi:conserved hypothetical protein [Altererythrobacter sp. B11]|nr:conserved hypothetical protein [Altererythrobacter sp. B11]